VSDDTVLQFGHSLREAPAAPDAPSPAPHEPPPPPPATQCPTCSSRFSPDGHFCPFDGTPLVAAHDWDPRADALLGTVVDDRYEVLSVIGEGGMGTVYQVRHRALGKRFALKALRKDLATDTDIAARFMQEARTAAAVSHPGLVEITDFGRLPSGQVYFVMELLEGTSLSALLRSGGPLPAARGLDIVRQLVHALKAAHDASIVHRDLKPDNVHIGKHDGERELVKIVDFGLAKVIGSSKLTRAGMVFGTPHYMSPEQAAGESVDHRADIYALGVVMYEMFAGKVPFEADSYMGVLTKHMYMEPTPPSQLSPELAELGVLEQVILRCLQKRPEARYPDLAALLADLDERLPGDGGAHGRRRQHGGISLLADQLELPTLPPESKRLEARFWPIAVVLLAFGLGAAVVLLTAGDDRQAGEPAASASTNAGGPLAVPATARPSVVPPAEAPSVQPATAESSTQASTAQPPARKPSRIAPRRTPAGGGVTTQPARKRGLGSGEIVDPWAR
jgi:serine/threonine-protein kinase